MMRCALVVLVLMTVAACGYERRDRGEPQQIAHDKSGAALTFGHIEQVDGTRFFTVPIVRVEHARSGSFSKYAGSDERNRLIVDSKTGASRRVLTNTDFSIVNWIEPKSRMSNSEADRMNRAAAGDESRSIGIYGAVVKRPGRTDKEPATYDLLFGKFEDGTQVWAARGLAGVEAVWLTTDRKLAVVAATAKGGVFRLYDPADFHQIMEKNLLL
jgi:hypothetical protein